MSKRSLAEWLQWQETLNPVEIDLGLERVRAVADVLGLCQPENGVFLVAGTNGKGSVVAALDALLLAAGLQVGTYTSPHLQRYNERICINGAPVSDDRLVAAFEAVEACRGEHSLTYFEYGTLAALWLFSAAGLDAWVIEVGLGGRLDATNIVDPDISLITTIALDHEAWLGDSIEAIAVEKAGIMRAGKPVLFGDPAGCATIVSEAERLGARLLLQGEDFGFAATAVDWDYESKRQGIAGLTLPPGDPLVQLQNRSLALAAVELLRPEVLADTVAVQEALSAPLPPGRFQSVSRNGRDWVLDVGHNPQAIAALASNLSSLPDKPLTIVLGMLEDKQAEAAARLLAPLAQCWVLTDVGGSRGQSARELAERLSLASIENVHIAAESSEAFRLAEELTPASGRVLVCGSFFIVGPALEWLTIDAELAG